MREAVTRGSERVVGLPSAHNNGRRRERECVCKRERASLSLDYWSGEKRPGQGPADLKLARIAALTRER